MNEEPIDSPGLHILDTTSQMKPNPCPDCGRKYPVGESVAVNVAGRSQPVWEGCIDCWVKRTSPEMCEKFLQKGPE